jgi:4'-phosphopantetheinyl transferase
MCEAYVVFLDRDLSDHEYQSLLLLVSPEKRSRIERFHHFIDAQRTLLGDMLIRMISRQKLGLDHEQITFSQNEWGKPFLVGYGDFHFNLSHAGRYVACVIDDEPVGIDIEEIKQIDMNIAKRYFNEKEKSYLFSFSEEQKRQVFFQIWTRKESYIKRDGRGLRIPLSSFSVFDTSDVTFYQIFENKEVVCNVCTAKQGQPPLVTTFVIDEMVGR